MRQPYHRTHVAVVSRIYLPEPAAASYRLGALVRALAEGGSRVRVVTSRAPKGFPVEDATQANVDVRRLWVLRDRFGYVRGYLHYLTFDVPAFFRVLFLPRTKVVVVEPPPTTGVFVRAACAIRRIPYVYYAADIWADAVRSTNAPTWIARWVGRFEGWAMRGADAVISASEEFTERIRELYPGARVQTVGSGVDTNVFTLHGPVEASERPFLLYAGTASEVHGATIFLDAFERVLTEVPDARLLFIGQGSDREQIERRAADFPVGSLEFRSRMAPEQIAGWIRAAAATLASVHPEGYHRAFPTKMYASVACGTPVLYAGSGPGRDFADVPGLGWGVDYEAGQVLAAMKLALGQGRTEADRERLATWAIENVSLAAVADRAVAVIESVRSPRREGP